MKPGDKKVDRDEIKNGKQIAKNNEQKQGADIIEIFSVIFFPDIVAAKPADKPDKHFKQDLGLARPFVKIADKQKADYYNESHNNPHTDEGIAEFEGKVAKIYFGDGCTVNFLEYFVHLLITSIIQI
jgi:hypothetical protein